MASPTSMQPAAWSAQELQNYALPTSIESSYSTKYSEYNPTPGAEQLQVSLSTLILSHLQRTAPSHTQTLGMCSKQFTMLWST